jgi:2-dehydropantoate 2-reductase
MAGAGAAPRRRPRAACSDLADAGLVDVVFVCVKTALLETIAAGMRQAWRPGTVCVSFQNGIDPEEILAGVAGPDHTLRAVLNLGGHVEAPGIYRMTWFRPPNVLGALTPAGRTHAEAVAALLEQAGLATRVVADIKRHAFEKAVLNAALCPVCALTGLSMGQAMALPPTRELATVLLREGRAVGERQGWAFERTLDEWLLYLEGGAGHRTSMHADLRAGRPTEIGFINGKICEHGARLGVPTPFNQAMTWAVLGRERRAAAE